MSRKKTASFNTDVIDDLAKEKNNDDSKSDQKDQTGQI